ncbi:MAG: hypothetical protein QOE51_661, partial [Actinoplanes sp.]|nr:hypothetical protein [Actinoplanes sp.]
MRRSHYRRESGWPFSGHRRIVAAVATLVAFGGIVTVTQVSSASTTARHTKKALAACANVQAPTATKLSTKTKKGTYTTNNGKVIQHADDGAGDVPTAAQMRTRCRQWVLQNTGKTAAGTPTAAATSAAGRNNNGGVNAPPTAAVTTSPAQNGGGAAVPPPAPGAGLGVLTNNCSTSKLLAHDGFQKGDRCVSTEFGEVGSA